MPRWQFTPLDEEALASLPESSRRFLTEVGLPAGVEIWMANIRKLIFTPVALKPIQLSSIDYLQIGYAASTAVFRNLPVNPIAIECVSGRVYLLNGLVMTAHEPKLPRWFFNSTIEKLVQSLMIYEDNRSLFAAHQHYVAEREKTLTGLHDARLAEAIKELRQHGQRIYEEIRPQLETIDPDAFDIRGDEANIWPDTLLEIRWTSSSLAD